MLVRKAALADLKEWSRMRHLLWPSLSVEGHEKEIEGFLKDPASVAFLAFAGDGEVRGFCEGSVRKYVNGCESSPVPFIEGIWVHESGRREGVGEALVRALEDWALDLGHREIGSDCEAGNLVSQNAHRKWGYEETERVVYFRKLLKA